MSLKKIIVAKYLQDDRPFIRGKCDCWTLIRDICAEFGYVLRDISDVDFDFSRSDWCYEGGEHLLKYATDWVEVNTPRIFDGVLFKNYKGISYHMGLMLDEFKFIHRHKKGVSVNRISDPSFKKRLGGFYRLKARHNA